MITAKLWFVDSLNNKDIFKIDINNRIVTFDCLNENNCYEGSWCGINNKSDHYKDILIDLKDIILGNNKELTITLSTNLNLPRWKVGFNEVKI